MIRRMTKAARRLGAGALSVGSNFDSCSLRPADAGETQKVPKFLQCRSHG